MDVDGEPDRKKQRQQEFFRPGQSLRLVDDVWAINLNRISPSDETLDTSLTWDWTWKLEAGDAGDPFVIISCNRLRRSRFGRAISYTDWDLLQAQQRRSDSGDSKF